VGGRNTGRTGRVLIEISSADLENISIAVPGVLSISGQITIEGRSNLHPSAIEVSMRREPNILNMPPVQQGVAVTGGTRGPANVVLPDGTFTFEGFYPGDYMISLGVGLPFNGSRFNLPHPAYVKSIRLGTTDLLREVLHMDGNPEGRLEITLGTDAGAIRGTVIDDERNLVPNSVVALVPEAALRFREDLYKSAVTDSRGGFQIQGIPPGDYTLFSWEDIENGAWLDTEFIARQGLGTPLRIRANANETIQLTVIPSGAIR
jgi:hypothetical protein